MLLFQNHTTTHIVTISSQRQLLVQNYKNIFVQIYRIALINGINTTDFSLFAHNNQLNCDSF